MIELVSFHYLSLALATRAYSKLDALFGLEPLELALLGSKLVFTHSDWRSMISDLDFSPHTTCTCTCACMYLYTFVVLNLRLTGMIQ